MRYEINETLKFYFLNIFNSTLQKSLKQLEWPSYGTGEIKNY